MGLTSLLASRAVRVAHVLLVEAPGSSRTRMAAEKAITGRGWQLATSPADADVLLTCGDPGEELESASNRAWDQMPGPRVWVTARSSDAVPAALDSAKSQLLDDRAQRIEAGKRRAGPPEPDDVAPMGTTRADDDDDDAAADMDDMDMDMDGDMDMDMSPGGIALAEDGPDTDGLDLDVLHIPLGPVLPHWPAGLALDCTVQGDLIMAADARWIDADQAVTEADDADPRWFAALQCDAAARLLGVAGWDAAASAARQIRDGVVDGDAADLCTGRMHALSARVSRSRILWWSLRSITVPGDEGVAVEVRTLAAQWLAAAVSALEGRPAQPAERVAVSELGTLVTGLDLASARIVVAALAPRLTVMSDA